VDLVALVILLAVVEYIVLAGLVGYARGKYGIRAPATTGNEAFERVFRVQQNTLEGLVIFLPGLWLFGQYLNPAWAVGLGVAGIVGRAIYAVGYIKAAEKRGFGAGICGMVNIALAVGALVGVIESLL
jgi:glutathione S-transferase